MNWKKIFKKIYSSIPFKKEMFSILKFFYTPSERIYKHLHFNGIFKVKIDSENYFKIHHISKVEENEIFWNGLYGGWEKKSIFLWTKLSKTSNIILDIGANTGLYGLVSQCVNPNAQVHCFEPINGVYDILEKNISKNNYSIKSHKLALSDYNGKGKIYLPLGAELAYSVTVNKNTLNESRVNEIDIDVMKLSTFIEQNKIENIDLMKIDVETHEVEVLNGMGYYLEKFKPTIIIEILSDEIAAKLSDIFDGLHYLYFNIDDKNNTIRRADRLAKSDYWNFLLCNEVIAMQLKLL
jgi:FkbM family methyltransferase